MPLPYIVDGNIDDLVASLKKVAKMGLENIVQGHGDIILRGEIEGYIKDNLAYLSAIRKVVRKSSKRKYPLDLLEEVSIEFLRKKPCADRWIGCRASPTQLARPLPPTLW